MRGTALFNRRKHRYLLTRNWQDDKSLAAGEPGRIVTWIMLNPSTADESVDDQTTQQCIKFSQNWEMDGLNVLNLSPYRSPDPDVLEKLTRNNLLGEEAKEMYSINLQSAFSAELFVCAWGDAVEKPKLKHLRATLDVIKQHIPQNAFQNKVVCLKKTAKGHPHHPLGLSPELKPQPFDLNKYVI